MNKKKRHQFRITCILSIYWLNAWPYGISQIRHPLYRWLSVNGCWTKAACKNDKGQLSSCNFDGRHLLIEETMNKNTINVWKRFAFNSKRVLIIANVICRLALSVQRSLLVCDHWIKTYWTYTTMKGSWYFLKAAFIQANVNRISTYIHNMAIPKTRSIVHMARSKESCHIK